MQPVSTSIHFDTVSQHYTTKKSMTSSEEKRLMKTNSTSYNIVIHNIYELVCTMRILWHTICTCTTWYAWRMQMYLIGYFVFLFIYFNNKVMFLFNKTMLESSYLCKVKIKVQNVANYNGFNLISFTCRTKPSRLESLPRAIAIWCMLPSMAGPAAIVSTRDCLSCSSPWMRASSAWFEDCWRL